MSDLTDRETHIAESAYIHGYEQGHHDTVESQYGDSSEIAAEMVPEIYLEAGFSGAPKDKRDETIAEMQEEIAKLKKKLKDSHRVKMTDSF